MPGAAKNSSAIGGVTATVFRSTPTCLNAAKMVNPRLDSLRIFYTRTPPDLDFGLQFRGPRMTVIHSKMAALSNTYTHTNTCTIGSFGSHTLTASFNLEYKNFIRVIIYRWFTRLIPVT